MRADDAGQQHKTLLARHQLLGQPDHPRQHPRHLDDGDGVFAAKGVLAAQANDEVQRLVGHQRKWMRRIQPNGNEQGPNLLLEELIDPLALRFGSVRVAQDHDALALEQRHQLVIEGGVLVVDQAMRVFGDGLDVTVGHARAGQSGSLEVVGKADLEKLVDVRRDDADVAQALEQRHIVPQGLRQNPPVEFEDRGLATQPERWIIGAEQRNLLGRLIGHHWGTAVCRHPAILGGLIATDLRTKPLLLPRRICRQAPAPGCLRSVAGWGGLALPIR